MAQTLQWLQENFSTQAFLRGLGIVFAVFVLLIVWIGLNEGRIHADHQDRLASQTILIEAFPVPYVQDELPPDPYPILQIPDAPDLEATVNIPATPIEAIPEPDPIISGPRLERLPSGLAVAPVPGLYEDTAIGRLPFVRASDGLTPFDAYKRPVNPALLEGERPLISIIVTDFGLSDTASEAALRTLPEDITLALSPYTPAPDLWMNEARIRGHEVWLSLLIESYAYPNRDTGPHTLLVGMSEEENLSKLHWLMSRTTGYVGLIASDRSELLRVPDIQPALEEIFVRGLGFIDTSTQTTLAVREKVDGHNAPYGRIHIRIDENPTRSEIQDHLRLLEDAARTHGHAIGVVSPLPISFEEVIPWVQTLADKGLILVPASTIAERSPSR